MKTFCRFTLLFILCASAPVVAMDVLTVIGVEDGVVSSERGTALEYLDHEIFDVYAEQATVEGVPTFLSFIDSVYLINVDDEKMEYGLTWSGQSAYIKEGYFLVATGKTLDIDNGNGVKLSGGRQNTGAPIKGIVYFGGDVYYLGLYDLINYDPDPYRAFIGLAINLDFTLILYEYVLLGSRVSAGSFPGIMVLEASVGAAYLKSLIPNFAMFSKFNYAMYQADQENMPLPDEFYVHPDLSRNFSIETGIYGLVPVNIAALKNRVYVEGSVRGTFYSANMAFLEPVFSIKIGYRYL